MVITVTADAVEYSAYVALNLVSINIGQLFVAPYNLVMSAANSLIAADIARLNLLGMSSQLKFTCLQNISVFVDGNITEYKLEVRQKRDEHNKKIKDQSDALNKRIDDANAAFQ